MTINKVAANLPEKPKVLIPYSQQWDIADHTPEWAELSKKVDFIKYKMTNRQDFQEFFSGSKTDCLWITDEFMEVLGGPKPFWDFYPDTLRAMVVPWVGCDFIDGDRLRKEKNITLCNIGPNASDNVADLAVFLLLSCFRMTSFWEHCFRFSTEGKVAETRKYVGGSKTEPFDMHLQNCTSSTSHSYSFPEVLNSDERSKMNLSKNFKIGGKLVESPMGKTALILGFGAIGQAIGKRLKLGFGMEVCYYKRSGAVSKDQLGYDATFHGSLESPETWEIADVIILALPGAPSTYNIINEKTLAMCKDGVRIVNVGRGSCVDEDALLDGLDSGKVTSCGLDVFKDEQTGIREEFLKRWDVTILPHIGSAVADFMFRQTFITLKNIQNIFIEGGDGIYSIN